MAVVLTLGPLLFADFEVPERINVGGEQMLVVHKLVGGSRVIDAMGRDDADIKWSGRFRGSAAEVRARLADFTRVQGQPMVLAWSTFRYNVLVKAFHADFEQQYEIPYSITCQVVQDLTSPILTALLGLDAAITTDLNQVVQIGAQINIPGITSAVSGVTSAVSAVQTFEGAASSVTSGALSAIDLAQGAVTGQQSLLNGVVEASGNVAGAVAGAAPASLISSLTAQASAFSQLGLLSQAQAYLGRMAVNVGQGGS
jgi:hypothetical protein